MKFKKDLQCMCLNATIFEFYEYIKIQHTCTKNVNCGKQGGINCIVKRTPRFRNIYNPFWQFQFNPVSTAWEKYINRSPLNYFPSHFSQYSDILTRDSSFVSERKHWSRTCGCNSCQNDSNTTVGLPQFTSWAVYYQEQFYQLQPLYSEPYPKHHGDYPNQYRQYPNYNGRYQNPYGQYPDRKYAKQQKHYNYKRVCSRLNHIGNDLNIEGVTVDPIDSSDGKSKYDYLTKLLIHFTKIICIRCFLLSLLVADDTNIFIKGIYVI